MSEQNGQVTQQLEFHPLAEAYNLLPDEDLQPLAESMQEHGYYKNDPVTLYEGKVLDGRNRYRAALLAGVEPEFEEFQGTREEAVAFVARKNDLRRHDTPDFRRKKRQERVAEAGRLKGQRRSIRDIAARLGVSKAQVERDLKEFQESQESPVSGPGVPGGGHLPDAVNGASGTNSKDSATSPPAMQNTPVTPPALPDPGTAPAATDGKAYPARRKRPPAPTPAAADPAPVDALGIPLTEAMAKVFADAPEFEAIAQAITALQRRVGNLAATPAGAVYATQLAGQASKGDGVRYRDEHLTNARNKVLWAVPYCSVCPYCHHTGREKDRSCKACRGLDWVTQRAFEAAPQDYQEAVRRLAHAHARKGGRK